MKFFEKVISLCITAHRDYPKKAENSVRKWDSRTPYYVHPWWCAAMFLQETNLPESINRENSAIALALHDIKEDTTMELPAWLPQGALDLIELMTFEKQEGISSTEIEIAEIWSRPTITRLLKLYDKVSNLLDGSWMPDEKWNDQYVPYVLRLADDVEKNYGQLNIVLFARAVAVSR